ncbi:MAG: hypothetical protein ACXVBO_08840, partial [Isosphaeraceae bacterium]
LLETVSVFFGVSYVTRRPESTRSAVCSPGSDSDEEALVSVHSTHNETAGMRDSPGSVFEKLENR